MQRAPLHSLYASLPFETLSPVSSVATLTPVQPVDPNLVHTVESVNSVKTSSPVQHVVPTVVKTLTPVVSVSTVSPLRSVDTVDPINSVGIVSHQPVETQHSVTEVLKTKSVPVIHIPNQTQQDKQFLNIFYQLAMMYLPNFRPPSSTSTTTPSSNANSKSESTSIPPVVKVSLLSDTYNRELVGVNNPVSVGKQVVSVTPANEYVQSTEANGGYVY